MSCFPPCDEVGGVCNATTLKCDCNEGYHYDRTYLRQDDCSLPDGLMININAVALGLCVLALVFTLRRYNEVTGIPRWILYNSTMFASTYTLLRIEQLIDGYSYSEATVIMLFLTFAFLFAPFHLIIYHFCSPLFIIAKAPDTNLKRTLFAVYVTFRIVGLTFAILVITSTNNHDWNLFMMLHQSSMVLEGLILLYGAVTLGRYMIVRVRKILSQAPANSNNERSRLYLRKTAATLFQLFVVGSILVGFFLFACVRFFINGYSSRYFLSTCIFAFVSPFIPMIFAIYASRQKEGNESESGSVMPSSPRLRAQTAQQMTNGNANLNLVGGSEKEFGTLQSLVSFRNFNANKNNQQQQQNAQEMPVEGNPKETETKDIQMLQNFQPTHIPSSANDSNLPPDYEYT